MLKELLNNAERYLIVQCALQDLEKWVLSNLQRILDSGDDEAIWLANQIDTDLVELGEGLINEVAFRERLQNYVSHYETIPFTFYEVETRDTVSATAAVKTINQSSVVPGPVEDLRLAHEFA